MKRQGIEKGGYWFLFWSAGVNKEENDDSIRSEVPEAPEGSRSSVLLRIGLHQKVSGVHACV